MELTRTVSAYVIVTIVVSLLLAGWIVACTLAIEQITGLMSGIVLFIGFIGVCFGFLATFLWLRDSLLELIEDEKRFD